MVATEKFEENGVDPGVGPGAIWAADQVGGASLEARENLNGEAAVRKGELSN